MSDPKRVRAVYVGETPVIFAGVGRVQRGDDVECWDFEAAQEGRADLAYPNAPEAKAARQAREARSKAAQASEGGEAA